MKVLGIESSCDETAVAVIDVEVKDGALFKKRLLSNTVFSQIEEHKKFGGVFPEVASRMHLDAIKPVFNLSIEEAGISVKDIDYVAATCGPGLVGSVVVGASFGKGLAYALNCPFIAVNHLMGHAMMPRLLYDDLEIPYLLILMSGGHSLIGVLKSPFVFHKFGSTIDDAAGECFDKVARMIELPYPGGPNVEKIAKSGDENRFKLPIPLNDQSCDFSFSGLKTAVLTVCNKNPIHDEQFKADLAASFQKTVGDVFEKKIKNAVKRARVQYPEIRSVVLSGGVAANRYLEHRVRNCVQKLGYELYVPDVKMCTDNAAMIAWAACEMLAKNPSINNIDTDILENNIFI